MWHAPISNLAEATPVASLGADIMQVMKGPKSISVLGGGHHCLHLLKPEQPT